jgi:hypothetical protein
MAKQWIKGAIKHPGALTAKAKAAGKTIDEYCSSGSLDTETKKQCVLAKTLKGFSKK